MSAVGLLVLIFDISLLFALTSAFSIYGVLYHRKNGSIPQYSARDPERLPNEHHDLSTNASDKLNDDPSLPLDHSNGGQYPPMHADTEEQTHPGGPITWNLQQPHTAPAELGVASDETTYYGGRHGYPPYDAGRPNNSQVGGGSIPSPSIHTGGHPSRQNLAQEYDHGGYASGGRVDFPEGDYSRWWRYS